MRYNCMEKVEKSQENSYNFINNPQIFLFSNIYEKEEKIFVSDEFGNGCRGECGYPF